MPPELRVFCFFSWSPNAIDMPVRASCLRSKSCQGCWLRSNPVTSLAQYNSTTLLYTVRTESWCYIPDKTYSAHCHALHLKLWNQEQGKSSMPIHLSYIFVFHEFPVCSWLQVKMATLTQWATQHLHVMSANAPSLTLTELSPSQVSRKTQVSHVLVWSKIKTLY